jgi:hypothetical protein
VSRWQREADTGAVVGGVVVGAPVVGGATVVGVAVVGVAVVAGAAVVVGFVVVPGRRRASAVTPSTLRVSASDGATPEQLASTLPSRRVAHRSATDRAVREGAIGFRSSSGDGIPSGFRHVRCRADRRGP